MKTKSLFLFPILLSLSLGALSDETFLENNQEIFNRKIEIEQLQKEKALNRSVFYPELNIVSGLGSEYSSGDAETEKGGILFLDAKMNLFRGLEDLDALKINDIKMQKAVLEKEIEIKKIKIDYYNMHSENEVLREEIKLIRQELEINKSHENMARKKVDSGLTSNVELLDFQIKQDTLANEISVNELKIAENEKSMSAIFGNKFTLEEINQKIAKENLELKKSKREDNLFIKKLTQDVSISQLEVKKTKSNYLPKIDLEAKIGSITPKSKVFEDKTEHQVALTLTIPLFSGFSTDASYQHAILDKKIKENSLNNYHANYSTMIDTEEKRIELNKLLLNANEKTLKKAEKFQEQTLLEYKRGIKNSPDLISASDRVFELKRKNLELHSDLKKAIYSYNMNYSE